MGGKTRNIAFSTQFATTFRNKLLVFLVRFTVAYLCIQPRPQGFSIQFEKSERRTSHFKGKCPGDEGGN